MTTPAPTTALVEEAIVEDLDVAAPAVPVPAGPAAPPDLRFLGVTAEEQALGADQRIIAPWVLSIRFAAGVWDLPRLVRDAAEAALAPLYALRDELKDGLDFQKAEGLRRQLVDAEAAAGEAAASGERHLALARKAMLNGKDPTKSERAYKESAGDVEVFKNRLVVLRDLHGQAAREAERGLIAALDAERAQLLAEVSRQAAELDLALLEAVRPLLLPWLTNRARMKRLSQDSPRLALNGLVGLAGEIAAGAASPLGARGGIPAPRPPG